MRIPKIARLSLGCLAAALAAIASPARADSWAMPRTASIESADGSFRLTVEPSPIPSQLDYFTEEVEAERTGKPVARAAPLAMLERRNSAGSYEPVWAKPLVNQVAPVELMIAPDGNRIVTFDNWHSVGHGENVIVIYDGAGDLVRSMPLSALLPEDYIEALPHSVSSLSWRRGERFSDDGTRLLLDVIIPSADTSGRETVERAIDLRDGSVIEAHGERWAYALAAARVRTVEMQDQETRRIAYLIEPLSAPKTPAERDWHEYLREAFARLTPDYLDGPTAATKVLFAPSNSRFDQSVDWLVDAFKDDVDFAGDIAVASPSSAEALVVALAKASAAVPKGQLTGGTIYVSIDAEHRAAAERHVARTGAAFVWLDPLRAIPQRPERVPGSAAKSAADEEINRRASAELDGMLSEVEGL